MPVGLRSCSLASLLKARNASLGPVMQRASPFGPIFRTLWHSLLVAWGKCRKPTCRLNRSLFEARPCVDLLLSLQGIPRLICKTLRLDPPFLNRPFLPGSGQYSEAKDP